jgi:hypothetical protein
MTLPTVSLKQVQKEWITGNILPTILCINRQGVLFHRWNGMVWFYHMEDGAEEWLRKQIALHSINKITGV